jgi:hypothetical protein
MAKYSWIFVFVIFVGVGSALLYQYFKSHRKCKKTLHWPTTTALILDSKMNEDQGRNAMGGVNVSYLITASYEYTVSGKKYQGDRVTFGRPAFNFISASSISEQFAVGKQVPVSYDPANPAESVLAPKDTTGMISWVPGAFFIVVGIVVALFGLLK